MFERFNEPLASMPRFIRRIIITIIFGLCLIAVVLAIGIAGYHYLGQLTWVDAFMNAAMILSGMGPVNLLPDNAAKIFAGFYALFSGLMFIMIIGLLFAPIAHRFFHRLHVDTNN